MKKAALVVSILMAASMIVLLANVHSAKAQIPGDLNGDHVVDVNDAILASLAFGSSLGDPQYDPAADMNSNGIIDIYDMIVLAQNFGNTD